MSLTADFTAFPAYILAFVIAHAEAFAAYLIAFAYTVASVWALTEFTRAGLENVRNYKNTTCDVAGRVGFFTLLLAMCFIWCRECVLLEPFVVWGYWFIVMFIAFWWMDHLATQRRRGFVDLVYD